MNVMEPGSGDHMDRPATSGPIPGSEADISREEPRPVNFQWAPALMPGHPSRKQAADRVVRGIEKNTPDGMLRADAGGPTGRVRRVQAKVVAAFRLLAGFQLVRRHPR
jgi:hypothetical protein